MFDFRNLEKLLQTGKTTKEKITGKIKIEAPDPVDVEEFCRPKFKTYSFTFDEFSETKIINGLTRAKKLVKLKKIQIFQKLYIQKRINTQLT